MAEASIEEMEREITKRKATLYRHHNYKEVCQICFRANKTCTERPSQERPSQDTQCPTHKGEWMMTLVAFADGDKSEVRPLPPNGIHSQMCKFPNNCKYKRSCKYPHTKTEQALWKEEYFIVQAVKCPRKCPKEQHCPSLCPYITNKGTCPNGNGCHSAHSDAELEAWIKDKNERSPQTYPWIPDAVKESMSCDSIPEKLLTLHGKCANQLPVGDPRGKLSSLIYIALPQLVIEETKSLKLPKDDPLADRTSHTYANSFSDELGMLSYKLVSLVDTKCQYMSDTLNNSADSRDYLGFLKNNIKLITNGPGDDIYMYCVILKLLCNQLAYRHYLVTSSPVEEIFQYGIPSFVMVMINYGVAIVHELIKMLKVKCGSEPSNEDQIKAIEGHYGNIQRIKQDYDSFCDYYRSNKEHYNSLATPEKIEIAKQVLHQLIDQANETNAEEIATELSTKCHIDIKTLSSCCD
jgi:hypothetical protein